MLQAIAVFVYISSSFIAVAILMSHVFKVQGVYIWIKSFLIILFVAAFLQNIWLVYLAIIFVGVKVIPQDRDWRVYYFLCLFCAFPSLAHLVPFPGINFLIRMEYHIFITVVLLMPVYIAERHNKSNLTAIDKLFFLFVVVAFLLDLRAAETITSSMRSLVTTFIAVWVPYCVLSTSKMELKSHLSAIFLVAAALAVEGCVEWGMVWKAYDTLVSNVAGVQGAGKGTRYAFRGLGLRISGSWNATLAFGAFMACGVFMALYSHRFGLKKSILRFAVAAVALAATLFTDSRGALIVVIVAIGTTFYFLSTSSGWKWLYVTCLVAGFSFMVTNMDLVYKYDTSGTFKYRADLLYYSQDALSKAPILGDPDFRSNPVLVENMMQGEGIVDIVNTYLRQALRYGAVGFTLFVLLWVVTIGSVVNRASLLQRIEHESFGPGMVLVGMLCGIAVMLYTVSMVGYMKEFMYMLFAISSAYIKNTQSVADSISDRS